MAATTRKAEQSEATRKRLLRVAHKLFAARGYEGTSIDEITRRTKLTRGALYHHFNGKRELFRAVVEDLERQQVEAINAVAAKESRPERRLEVGAQAFLDVCMQPAVQRIILLDGPSVLGWDDWHEIDAKYGLGMMTEALQVAMDAGYIERQPVDSLAPLVLGALNEAVFTIARADDVKKKRAEVGRAVARLLAGLRARE